MGGLAFWFAAGCVGTLVLAFIVMYAILADHDRRYGVQLGRREADLKAEREKRERAEADLKKERDFHELIFNNSNDMVFVHGISSEGLPTAFIKVNDVACAKLGYSREKLLQMTPVDIQEMEAATGGQGMGYSRSELVTLSDNDIVERENAFTRVHTAQILEKKHLVYERTYICANGKRMPVEIKADRINILGEPSIIFTATDVTERLATQKALHESEQRFRDFFSNSPIGVAMYDAQKQLLSVNRSCLRMFGIPDQQEFSKFDLFDNPFIPQSEKAAILKGQSVHFDTMIDFDEVRRLFMFVTGRRGKAAFEIFVNDLGRDANYNVKGHIVQVMDVTDRWKVEQALRDSEQQLRQAQKMEAMGTLAGGIAHDFNNILTPILGYTEMALHMLPETDPMREFMKEISKGSYRARELVGQILTFSRRAEPDPKPIHVIPIVKEALNLLGSSAPKAIEITRSIKTDHDIVMGDPTQIHQIIMNLCTNAIYAMREKGAGALEVWITDFTITQYGRSDFSNLEPGRYLRISVKDSGSGIEKAIADRIFEPFFTTKPRGEGTGMGLAVVHGIASSMKGLITLESEVGVGSTFHVVLPTVDAAVVPVMDSETDLPIGRECIMFVDDDQDITKLVDKMVVSLGYTCIAVNHARAALKVFSLEPQKIQLVITDQIMPGMTGLELTRELLAIRPRLPVIMCTCFTETSTKQEAEAAGVKDFISKPIMMKELADTIRRTLDVKSDD